MGVAVLQAYPPPADKTVQQAVEILQRRILNLGATHTGQVRDCVTTDKLRLFGKLGNTTSCAKKEKFDRFPSL